jgi:hypothetical protein
LDFGTAWSVPPWLSLNDVIIFCTHRLSFLGDNTEAHIKQLTESSQPIPRHINLLLANARRKQEKQVRKKLANRKSAFTSRMNKKARSDAMERENLRLKRESIVLSFIPDPVSFIVDHDMILLMHLWLWS